MIKIIKVGKIKRNSMKKEYEYFYHKIKSFMNIKVINVNEAKYKEESKNIKEESKRLYDKVGQTDYSICLDKSGNKIDSMQLADKLDNMLSHGKYPTFIIGGAFGLSEEIKSKSDYIMSFSEFTIQHDIILIVLMEQIYRSLSIIKGYPYHK